MIRTLISLLFIGLTFHAFGQNNKFDLEFSINPNLSSFMGHIVYLNHHGPTAPAPKKLSYNVNFSLILAPENKISPTIGLTYLNFGHRDIGEAYFYPEISEWTSSTIHHLMAMPIGIRVNLKNTFISPELGIATTLTSRRNNMLTYVDGTKETDVRSLRQSNNVVHPIFLTIGHQLRLKSSTSLIVGLRAYIVPEVRSNTYYGYGLFLGVKL